MSWFDATGFANLAKSALKEAQKTIDKALDIKDEENRSVSESKVGSPASPEADADNFFASWGLKTSGENVSEVTTACPDVSVPSHNKSSTSNRLAMTTSLWGSFTGSFFENPRLSGGSKTDLQDLEDMDDDPVSRQPKKISLFRASSLNQEGFSSGKENHSGRKGSWDRGDLYKSLDNEEAGLCDDSSELGERFSRSKLVVESEDGDVDMQLRLSTCEADEDRTSELGSSDKYTEPSDLWRKGSADGSEMLPDLCADDVPGLDNPISVVVTRRKEPTTNNYRYNRLSVISSESDKKSSESVEVLGSASSDCGSGFTTSPESDMPLLSPGMSTSSSNMALRLSAHVSSPDSVEVIPDTPSSVEVLGEDSGRTSRMTVGSSPYVSPDEPLAPPSTLELSASIDPEQLSYSLDRYHREKPVAEKVSPESVEVIPEEEEDEEDMSVADDSYTSASESTATATTTIMEPLPVAFTPDLSKSPHHKGHSQSAESSSTESSLYASTISAKTESSAELKSPHGSCVKLPQQNLGSMESFHESLVQSSVIIEEPVMTHGGRSGLQLSLMHTEVTVTPKVSDKVGRDELKTVDYLLEPPEIDGNRLPRFNTQASVSSCDSTSDEKQILLDKQIATNTDSSGEGTILESSSDDTIVTTVVEDTTEKGSKSPSQQTSSYYMKTLLADAIGDEEAKDSRTELTLGRDQSPISSESRSDMVKVESEQTSGHTSGDEIETTTSSDIEIISSPNGDSSSTQSRQSPAKLLQHVPRGKITSTGAEALAKASSSKVKGHQRELSETSSGGSEDNHCIEVDKLLKRMTEMTEILEARESKLIELSRRNVELQETNSDLKCQLEAAVQSRAAECQDIHQVTEEYTQRLSSLERKFQQAIREKEALRKQLDQAKIDAASRLSMSELETSLAERDEVIRELREEGDKLSKQHLTHSNIIKKLRAKEKESDNTIKKQKDQLEESGQEIDRLQRSLAAKEEVERTQIEAVHQLTAKTKRQEKELLSLGTQLEEASQKLACLTESLETAHSELAARDETHQELSARSELQAQLEEALLRLRHAEEEYSARETVLRQENCDLLRRLESAEARSEELAQSVSGATRPLLRQIEALQATCNAQQASWEKHERNLTASLSEAQSRLVSLTEQERSSREECLELRSRVLGLEARLAAATKEASDIRSELEQQRAHYSQLKQAKDQEASGMASLRQSVSDELAELRREVNSLEQQMAVERAATEAERRRTTHLQDQLKEREVGVGSSMERDRSGLRASPAASGHSSPTLSFGRASLSESISSAVWPQFQDDSFECGSTSGRLSNVYDSLRAGNTTSLLEGLQAQLKLRDGEVQQLQWEMSRRDSERAALTAELSQLTALVEAQEARLREAERLQGQFDDVQHKYNALLQMYGEKVEEAEELKLDLVDVKEMYKTQIDQLLKKESTL